jgi:hypothetical protein
VKVQFGDLYFISSENQCIYIYIIQKWDQNVGKNGFWVSSFHPKNQPDALKVPPQIFLNIGFIVFNTVPTQQSVN